MKSKEWFCLNCKKQVNVRVLPYGTGFIVCKECWGNRVIELERVSEKEFEELIKKFKEKDGKITS
jgi:DNA-directed RNA polymerase subunit RPC12/RpoP